MPDLSRYQAEFSMRPVRIFKEKPDAVVALMARENGEQLVCRLYAHRAGGYDAAQGLQLPQLPAIYRSTAFDGGWLVEEEFVDGIHLSELLEVYRPDVPQTCAIIAHLCRGLSALHQREIIHRDIKPENILITSAGRVALIDLDASSRPDPEKDRDTRLLGTVGYAAPEQFGFGRSDVRTDIFSLGVLMNTMLTGEHPSKTLASGPLRPVIQRCIAVNADQRYADTGLLLRDILPLAGNDARCPECGFVSPGGGCLYCGREAPPLRRSKRRLLWWAAAAAAVCGLGFLALGRQQPLPQSVPAAASVIQTTFSRSPLPIRYENEDFHFTQALPQMPVPFQYDADGDGTGETYYFGLLQNEREDPHYSMWDSVGRPYDESDRVFRTAAPVIFEKDADGRYVPAQELAPCIQNPDITVYYLDLYFGEEAEMPVITPAAALYGCWQGAEYIEYSMGCIGGWVIEASADIDGEHYTAFVLTEVRTDWRGIPLT